MSEKHSVEQRRYCGNRLQQKQQITIRILDRWLVVNKIYNHGSSMNLIRKQHDKRISNIKQVTFKTN